MECGREEGEGIVDDSKWRDAYLAMRQDAAIGRHFRGIVHNLNGVVQAFSMQAELLAMMFDRAFALLDEMGNKASAGECARLDDLAGLLRKRAALPQQMAEKVTACQDIVNHVLAPCLLLEKNSREEETADVNAVLRGGMDFLLADSFFKHRVEKKTELAAGMPPVAMPHAALRHVVAMLLDNALDALRDVAAPRLCVSTSMAGEFARMTIENIGGHVDPENFEMIFAPFFSTRQGHAGLGLYLVRRLVEAHGGRIVVENGSHGLRAVVDLPVAGGETGR